MTGGAILGGVAAAPLVAARTLALGTVGSMAGKKIGHELEASARRSGLQKAHGRPRDGRGPVVAAAGSPLRSLAPRRPWSLCGWLPTHGPRRWRGTSWGQSRQP
jgi:hypothetical protein